MLKQKGPVAVICLLLAVLLLGCAAEPKTRPTPAGTLPGLETGTAESWAPAQSQSFPNTDYTLPDLTEQTETSIGNEPTAAPWTDETAPVSTETPPASETAAPSSAAPAPSSSGFPVSSPEDIPAPTNPPEASPLESILTRELENLDGVWSVYARNLKTGETVCIHDEPMVAASLIKLYVAGAYYETDPKAEDRNWCARADVMISASSNDACNALIDRLGMDTVNEFIRGRGDADSALNRKMLEKTDRENYITARAAGEILEDILSGRYVSAAASGRLLQNLKEQQRTWKLPAGVPDGVETANKTGELSDTENDACIVWSPGGTYILCVLSTELPNVMTAREEIVRISTLVYEYFNETND